jgi:hypothetical protein
VIEAGTRFALPHAAAGQAMTRCIRPLCPEAKQRRATPRNLEHLSCAAVSAYIVQQLGVATMPKNPRPASPSRMPSVALQQELSNSRWNARQIAAFGIDAVHDR